jgi:hypothetical protein
MLGIIQQFGAYIQSYYVTITIQVIDLPFLNKKTLFLRFFQPSKLHPGYQLYMPFRHPATPL